MEITQITQSFLSFLFGLMTSGSGFEFIRMNHLGFWGLESTLSETSGGIIEVSVDAT